ncbi:MAG: carbon storage regulator, partial [Planctomycetales bacterium]|nr:carbon storage regulator [Planctomycetales bacterium]
MLVLSRKVGQSLVIAEGVTVTVSEIGPDYVR